MEAENETAQANDGSGWSNFKNCCLWPAAGALALSIGIGFASCGGESDEPEPSADLAKDACESHVKDYLKNPASAQFSGGRASGGPTDFTVSGTVRGENSFGGTAVQTFTCTAMWNEDEATYYTTVDSIE